MTSMTVTASEVTRALSRHEARARVRRPWSGRAIGVALALTAVLSGTGPALAQTAPAAPPTAAPVEPLPPPPSAATSPPPVGAGATSPALYGDPQPPYLVQSAAATDPMLAPPPPPDEPIYDKWWFWTAIGAIAVVGLVVAVSASSSKTPSTYFGNGRAF